jgi:cardiolipin synthase
MNLRASHLAARKAGRVEQDVHFRFGGPVVEHLQEAFVDDWSFATGEALLRGKWFAERPEAKGAVSARGVPFDPGEKLDTLRNVLVGALSAARSSVRIMSPYFLPEPALISALNVAALRGVEVDILVPERNDSRVVQWAMEAQHWQVLSSGCRIWRTPPPFEHSKLMTVDGAWTFLGSANLDPRSLRLNFEFNVECYDRALAARMDAFIESKRAVSKPVTLKEVNARPAPVKLRDGLARLFSPYL